MDISALAVKVIILMLPGIIAALIVERLTVHEPWDSFRFGLYALLLGFLSYLALQLFFLIFQCVSGGRILTIWKSVESPTPILDFMEIVEAIGAGIVLGLLTSAGITRRWFHLFAKRIGVTEKYGDESLFYFFLNSTSVTWVRVVDVNSNRIYEGYRESFSDLRGCREVLLRAVKVYRLQDSAFLYDLDSIYLSSVSSALTIEQP